MNKNTQNLLIIGGAAVAGLYLYMNQSEDYSGFGGGGGIPLLPVLPDETVEPAGSGDTIITIPPMEIPDWFTNDPEPEKAAPKKGAFVPPVDATISSISFEELTKDPTTAESTFLGMATTAVPYPGSPLDVSKLPKKPVVEAKPKGAPWWNPFAWNVEDAKENYLTYSDKTWGPLGTKTDNKPESKKVISRAIPSSDRITRTKTIKNQVDRVKVMNSDKIMVGKKEGYSTMHRLPSGVMNRPAWKQLGYRRPTAPGQPNRY